MYSILIIEDDKRVADLLKTGLEENGYNAFVAYDGAMGLRLFQSHAFQLVISDIILPKLDGFDAGADDYMVKPFDFRELNARIKVLLKRKNEAESPTAPPDKLNYKDLQVDTSRREVTRQGIPIRLSPKEYNLLTYMVQHPERVISRVEIAEKVWNTHFDTGTNFIDVYINYLRKKIDKDFDTKLIHTKPGIGFILTDEKP